MKKTTRNWLILILLLSTLVRLVHFNSISHTSFTDIPLHADWTDMYAYWQWSGRITDGDWLGRDTYHPHFRWMADLGDAAAWHRWWGDERVFQQEPLYPYFLALGRMAGFSIAGLMLAQLLLGVLQPLATFWLTRSVFRHDASALISAVIAGFYGPLIFNQGVMLRDWTGPLIESLGLLAFLFALERDRDLSWIWPGLVFGIALMTHSAVMAFLPLMFAWIAWVHRDSLTRIVRRAGAVAGGLLVGFSPLMIRNLLVGTAPFSITNRLPEAIVHGNAADTFPLGMTVPASMPTILEQSGGSAWTAAMETVRTHGDDWIGFLKLQALKFRGNLDPLEIPNNLSYAFAQDISAVLSLLPDFGWLLPLAALGLLLVLRTGKLDHRHALLFCFGLATFAALMAGPVYGRYRLAISTVMFVYAGWAAWQLWVLGVQGRYQKALMPGLALLVFVVVQHVLIPVQESRQNIFLSLHPMSYQASVDVYQARGRPDLAIEEWKRLQAVAENANATLVADESVRRQQALHLEIALMMKGDETGRLVDWHLSEVDGLFDYRNDSRIRDYTLGVAYLRTGRRGAALERLQRFIEDHPDMQEAEQARELVADILGGAAGRPR